MRWVFTQTCLIMVIELSAQLSITNRSHQVYQALSNQENYNPKTLIGFEFLHTEYSAKNFFSYADEEDNWRVNPLVSLSAGADQIGRLLYQNELGFHASYRTSSKKFSFSVAPSFGNAELPLYNELEALNTLHVPGKGFTFSNSFFGGWNYASILGAMEYKPSKYFTFNIGNGRHFIGNGYRSLLLSDYSRPHPYAAISTSVWKLKYVNLFSAYAQDPTNDAFFYPPNKFSTIHYLSWQVTEKFSLGLFEAVIWKSQDTLLSRGFDVNYLNPVIFYRPVEYSTGSSDNVLMAINANWKSKKGLSIYGQFLIDEFLLKYISADISSKLRPGAPTNEPTGWWANKHAGQLGFKWAEPLNVKGFMLQAEFNYARPFTYTHVGPSENYGNYQAPLAHPYGANFVEWLVFTDYVVGNWQLGISWQNTLRGMTNRFTQTNFGSDIFKPYQTREQEFGNRIGQGNAYRIHYYMINASYMLNQNTNMRAFVKAGFRLDEHLISTTSNNDAWLMMGISSNLFNDFDRF